MITPLPATYCVAIGGAVEYVRRQPAAAGRRCDVDAIGFRCLDRFGLARYSRGVEIGGPQIGKAGHVRAGKDSHLDPPGLARPTGQFHAAFLAFSQKHGRLPLRYPLRVRSRHVLGFDAVAPLAFQSDGQQKSMFHGFASAARLLGRPWSIGLAFRISSLLELNICGPAQLDYRDRVDDRRSRPDSERYFREVGRHRGQGYQESSRERYREADYGLPTQVLISLLTESERYFTTCSPPRTEFESLGAVMVIPRIRRRVVRIVLLTFHVRLDVQRRNQLYLVTQALQFPPPMMRSTTRVDRHRAM